MKMKPRQGVGVASSALCSLISVLAATSRHPRLFPTRGRDPQPHRFRFRGTNPARRTGFAVSPPLAFSVQIRVNTYAHADGRNPACRSARAIRASVEQTNQKETTWRISSGPSDPQTAATPSTATPPTRRRTSPKGHSSRARVTPTTAPRGHSTTGWGDGGNGRTRWRTTRASRTPRAGRSHACDTVSCRCRCAAARRCRRYCAKRASPSGNGSVGARTRNARERPREESRKNSERACTGLKGRDRFRSSGFAECNYNYLFCLMFVRA